VPEISKNKLTS